MNDNYIFQNTRQDDQPKVYFTKKTLKWTNDNNMGVSNTFTIDSKDISTNGDISALSEAFMAIPYMVAISGSAVMYTANTADLINQGFGQLKSGLNLFDSLTLQWGQETINTTQQNINQILNFKVLSTYTDEEYKKWSDPMMFAVDDTSGITLNSTSANATGEGCSNNRFLSQTTFTTGAFPASVVGGGNSAMLKRARNIIPFTRINKGYCNNITTTPTTYLSADMYNIGQNYFGDNGLGDTTTADTDRVYYYNLLITIRLQDLFDIFKKVDLCINPNFRITATLNTMKATITTTKGTSAPKMVHASYQQLSGNTNPFIVASSTANEPNNTLVANADNTLTVEGNLPKANGTATGN